MMDLTRHARERQRQRGIRDDDIEILMAYGEIVPRQGRAYELYFKHEEIEALCRNFRRIVSTLSRMHGKAVLLSEAGKVITVYRKPDACARQGRQSSTTDAHTGEGI